MGQALCSTAARELTFYATIFVLGMALGGFLVARLKIWSAEKAGSPEGGAADG